MKPCPCGGSNEACYFCGGKGAFAELPQPAPTPARNPQKARRQGSVVPRSQSLPAAASLARKTFEGPKIQCPGCRALMTKKAFAAHLEACPRTFLYEKCRWCSERMLRSRLEGHSRNCSKRAVSKSPAKSQGSLSTQAQNPRPRRCPKCGAPVSKKGMNNHLFKVHRMLPRETRPTRASPSKVRAGRRVVIGRTLPVKNKAVRPPRSSVVTDEQRPKALGGRQDVFDLPSKLLVYGGAFDSSRRRH